jgi:hypothetical protein
MNRDATLLLALVLLAVAAVVVGVSGWILFVRDRRAHTQRTAKSEPSALEEA